MAICCRRWLPVDEPLSKSRSAGSVAIAILCKTPSPGGSKTRLSPPLTPAECAQLSACFIADLSQTIADVASQDDVTAFAVYTPSGTEQALRELLPTPFDLVLQAEGDFGVRLEQGIRALLAKGHVGAILVNSDSPTLPAAILQQAVTAVRQGDTVVLSPALDGGYTLIGLSAAHPLLFAQIPWSTGEVFAQTVARAEANGLSVRVIDGWYDVDDAASFAILEREMQGLRPPVKGDSAPQPALRTRDFLRGRRARVAQE